MQARAMSEDELDANLVDAAEKLGWSLTYHTHDSRHSPAGFPDRVLVRPGQMIIAELKKQNGKATTAQAEWLAMLETVAAAVAALTPIGAPVALRVYTWRPADWLSGSIQAVLAGGDHTR